MDVIVVKFLVIAIMFLLLLILMILATWSQMRKGERLVVAHNWRIVVAEVRVLSVAGAHHDLPKAGKLKLRFELKLSSWN